MKAVRTLVSTPRHSPPPPPTAVPTKADNAAGLLNPWGFLLWWLVGYAAVRAALLGFVDGFVAWGPRLGAACGAQARNTAINLVMSPTW